MDKLLVFNHWPKCGGTSVRNSIEAAFERDELLYCYGKDGLRATLTTQGKSNFLSVYLSLHRDEHNWEIDAKVADGKIQVIFGHVAPFPGAITSRDALYVTMMRHPFTRFVSHYNHHARYMKGNPDVSFEEFIQRDIFGVEDIDIVNRYDLVLFYEEYSSGLAKLSEVIGRPLNERRDNVSPQFLTRSEETDAIVRRHRQGRVAMYEFARRKFS